MFSQQTKRKRREEKEDRDLRRLDLDERQDLRQTLLQRRQETAIQQPLINGQAYVDPIHGELVAVSTKRVAAPSCSVWIGPLPLRALSDH